MRLRIAKKETAGGWRAVVIRIASVLVALLLSGLLMAAMGFDPIAAYAAIAKGSFGSARGLINTVTVAIPLLIVALGLSISFSMRFWNIGGEGQLIMELIADTGKLHSVDIVEINPILDIQNRTAQVAVDLAASLFGKKIL